MTTADRYAEFRAGLNIPIKLSWADAIGSQHEVETRAKTGHRKRQFGWRKGEFRNAKRHKKFNL